MRALALLLLAVPVLGGCTSPLGGAPCDHPGHWLAGWDDPGLAGALPADGRHGRLQVTSRAPGAGLPFSDPSLDARWGAYALVEVRWNALPDSSSGREMVRLLRNGTAEGLLDASRSITDIQGLFLEFARNLSAAPEGELANASRVFYQSRQPGAYGTASGEPQVMSYAYRAALPGPLRIAEHFRATTPPAPSGGDAGRVAVQGQGWAFEFERGVRRAEGSIEGRPVVLAADPAGPVSWSLEAQEDVPEAAARQAFNATFADLGRAPPAAPPMRFAAGPVC